MFCKRLNGKCQVIQYYSCSFSEPKVYRRFSFQSQLLGDIKCQKLLLIRRSIVFGFRKTKKILERLLETANACRWPPCGRFGVSAFYIRCYRARLCLTARWFYFFTENTIFFIKTVDIQFRLPYTEYCNVAFNQAMQVAQLKDIRGYGDHRGMVL